MACRAFKVLRGSGIQAKAKFMLISKFDGFARKSWKQAEHKQRKEIVVCIA
jgi:hypothetical protein